jgi:hypothetical protein
MVCFEYFSKGNKSLFTIAEHDIHSIIVSDVRIDNFYHINSGIFAYPPFAKYSRLKKTSSISLTHYINSAFFVNS